MSNERTATPFRPGVVSSRRDRERREYQASLVCQVSFDKHLAEEKAKREAEEAERLEKKRAARRAERAERKARKHRAIERQKREQERREREAERKRKHEEWLARRAEAAKRFLAELVWYKPPSAGDWLATALTWHRRWPVNRMGRPLPTEPEHCEVGDLLLNPPKGEKDERPSCVEQTWGEVSVEEWADRLWEAMIGKEDYASRSEDEDEQALRTKALLQGYFGITREDVLAELLPLQGFACFEKKADDDPDLYGDEVQKSEVYYAERGKNSKNRPTIASLFHHDCPEQREPARADQLKRKRTNRKESADAAE